MHMIESGVAERELYGVSGSVMRRCIALRMGREFG